jgi:hypothetical protein
VRRIRIEKPKVHRERPWLEALPLDPRDPDVVRAKALGRSDDRRLDVARECAQRGQRWAC